MDLSYIKIFVSGAGGFEKVITPFNSLDSYVNSDGESTITFSDVTYYNGDVSIYKYSDSNLKTYLSDLDDRVTGYCNLV